MAVLMFLVALGLIPYIVIQILNYVCVAFIRYAFKMVRRLKWWD